MYSVLKSKLLVGYAVLTYIVHSGSADPGEWDNLVLLELDELADIPTEILIFLRVLGPLLEQKASISGSG